MSDLDNMLLRLIIPKYPQFNIYSFIRMPPVGPVLIGTIARDNGINVEIIDENNSKGELDHRKLQAENPADYVGFYCGLTSTINRVYELAELYKKMGTTTIGGGMHVLFETEEALNNHIDYVVLGEGEHTLPELLHGLATGKDVADIKGIAFLENGEVKKSFRPQIKNLDKLPYPDYSLLKNLKKPLRTIPIVKSRGCNWDCNFCGVKMFFGNSRGRSAESVMGELEHHRENGYHSFFGVDDEFVGNRDETVKLLKLIIENNAIIKKQPNFTIQVRSDIAKDAELLELMKKAGVSNLCIGYESPYSKELKAMGKCISREEHIRNTRSLKKFGFAIHAMLMFRYPIVDNISDRLVPVFELKDSIKERIADYKSFIRKLKSDSIQVLHTIPLPGTKLYRQMKGYIYPHKLIPWSKYDGQYTVWHSPGANMKMIQDAPLKLMKWFYKGVGPSMSILFSGLIKYNPFSQDSRVTFKNKMKYFTIHLCAPKIIRKWKNNFQNEGFYDKLTRAQKQISTKKTSV